MRRNPKSPSAFSNHAKRARLESDLREQQEYAYQQAVIDLKKGRSLFLIVPRLRSQYRQLEMEMRYRL